MIVKPVFRYKWELILFLFPFLLYVNTLFNGYVLDDFGVLKDNQIVRQGVKGVPVIMSTPYRYGVNRFTDNLYRPLSLVMFAVEWQIAPGNPAVNHFVNVLFYSFSCLLLFVLLKKLFSSYPPMLPIITCLLFAAHPIHTEVVANIKSRDEIMSVFFLFLSFYLFMNYLEKGKKKFFLFSLIVFTLAVFSKEGIIPFLAVFPLAGWYFTKTDIKKVLLYSVLFLSPIILFFIVKHVVWIPFEGHLEISLVDNIFKAIPTLSSRLATILLILGKYFFLLVAPFKLVSDYSYNQIPAVGWNSWEVWFALIAYLAAIVYSICYLRKKDLLAFGLLCYLISIGIYSNIFVFIGSSFAERFLYLPSLGFCIVIAWILVAIFRIGDSKKEDFKKNTGNIWRIWIVLLAIITIYSVKTFSRNLDWRSEEALFSRDVKRSPRSCHMRYYWGNSLFTKATKQTDFNASRSMLVDAIHQYDTALIIYPGYNECYNQ